MTTAIAPDWVPLGAEDSTGRSVIVGGYRPKGSPHSKWFFDIPLLGGLILLAY